MLGYHAVNMACEQKDNHEVSKLQIPSFFVARDSLGFCDSAEKRLHTSLDNLLKKHAPFDEIWNTISNTLTTGNYHIATTQTYKKLRSILFQSTAWTSQYCISRMSSRHYSRKSTI